MTANQLRRAISTLPKSGDELFPRDQYDRTQQTHWLRWLATKSRADPARRIYNAIQCPHMLVYLAWALGGFETEVRSALRLFPHDPKQLDRSCGAQSKAVRAILPWELIEARIGSTRAGTVPARLRRALR